MQCRTDLAIEERERVQGELDGAETEMITAGDLCICRMTIRTQQAADRLHKPIGRYITAEGLSLTRHFREVREHIEVLAAEVASLLPPEGMLLVAGLGNRAITPDALGPACTEHILATRHIRGEIAKSTGLHRLRPVSVIAPGVLGQTGVEVAELLSAFVKELEPSAVIVIDALAAGSMNRLGNTVQLSSAGIAPGSGVGNCRPRLDQKALGVPVVAVGIPTVADAAVLSDSSDDQAGKPAESMMVTPRDIDLLIRRSAKLLGMAVNCAVQPEYDFDTLAELITA